MSWGQSGRIRSHWQRGLLIVGVWLSSALAAYGQISPEDLLPVDEAFALEAERNADTIELTWTIAPGYYLYKHAFRVSAQNATLGEWVAPQGKVTEDEFFGRTETYRDQVTVVVPLASSPAQAIELDVVSQGCADLGVCYPPHRQRLSLAAPAQWTPPRLGASDASSVANLTGISGASALPAEQAFDVQAIATDAQTILVRFRSQPDYYIYEASLGFSSATEGVSVEGFVTPAGQPIEDEYFGLSQVYFGEFEVPVAVQAEAPDTRNMSLVVAFQGCLTDGICYPPMTRELRVELVEAEVGSTGSDLSSGSGSASLPVAEQDRLAQALANTPILALALFLVAGMLLAFTPCVFPMVPILSGLIAGEGETIDTQRAFRLSVVYVLSMALVYTAFGVVAGLFGQNLQALFQHPYVLSAFALLFVLLSLAMFGFYELQLPSRVQTKLNELSNRAEGGTLMGAAIMGALSALVVGPCVAPALMGALIYIGQTGDALMGGGALFAMAIGMGIPLVIWGTSAGRWLPKAGAWMSAVKAVFGVGLLALAIWMLERVIPAPVVMALWGSLAIGCGVYLGALMRLDHQASGWQKLWQALGVILLLLGIAQWIGALSGGRDWTRPLSHWQGGSVTATVQPVSFAKVDTLDQLQAAITAANQPVFLDFYADWCVDCVRMERRTFIDPAVVSRLAEFSLIKVDVTDYTDDHRDILSHFGLIGPPAMLFFNNGQELQSMRRFGFMAPPEFLNHLDAIENSVR